MSEPTVLVIEDDADLRALLAALLTAIGLKVREASTGERGLEMAQQLPPDVVVLDVELPGIHGVEVCRRLRTFCDSPVLFLTARTEETDIVMGFAAGGDDYLGKPFSSAVFSARVAALLRRTTRNTPMVVAGNLTVDLDGMTVRVNEATLELTRGEFELLAALAREAGRVVLRGALADAIGADVASDDHAVDVTMSRLRAKLNTAGAPRQLIGTHRGLGYRMNLNPQAP